MNKGMDMKKETNYYMCFSEDLAISKQGFEPMIYEISGSKLSFPITKKIIPTLCIDIVRQSGLIYISL